MLTAIKERLGREDREDGFTLIELMVVVLIIGILMAIAIPTFLSAKQGASDKAAQSNLHNALTAEASYYTSNQNYGDTTTTPSMATAEPNIDWTAATTNLTSQQVSVAAAAGGQSVTLIAQDPKYCFEVVQNATSGAGYAFTTNTAGTCGTFPATSADESTGWKTS